MTLKEIYKIIDEANFYDSNYTGTRSIFSQGEKNKAKGCIKECIKMGFVYFFYKINDNGEVENRWLVDHIDKEKKIVKKKLDEMTDKELDNLFKKNCKYNSRGCENCPLILQIKDGLISCIYGFREAKRTYDFFKDKEFEIEVEE